MSIFTKEQFSAFESLVRNCGRFMLTAEDIENTDGSIKKKSGDADFVTVFDEAVQSRLIDGILKIFPYAVFFAEEKENFAEDTSEGLCFVIDPIDGTTNFIHALGASSISVAVLKDGHLVFGLIYDPYRDELFYASEGEGAYCNGRRIFVSDRDMQTAVVAFGTTPYKKKEYAEKGFKIAESIFCNCADIRRSGSAAIDLACVACGRLDAFFECILSPWDYAAGAIIVKEAGGTLTDMCGKPIGFSKPSSVLCSNNLIHDKLIALINK